MAPVIPDPRKIRAFKTQTAFETWLRAQHARETEIWLRIYKKASGKPTVTAAQALDVALCWGWIDGIRKSFDADSFLQRYSPRRPRSIWSQVNRDDPGRPSCGDRREPAGAQGTPDARTAEPVRARLPYQQHEDTGRAGPTDRVARGDARARGDHCSASDAPQAL